MELGVVGTGLMVDMILPHMAGWGVDVRALCGSPRSAEKVQATADEFDIERRYTDYRELVRDPKIDTVYVAVPNNLHREVVLAALEAGKHVVCEKPLASNAREAQELADRADDLGLFLWEAATTTRQPNFLLVRDELLDRIGDIKIAIVNFSQYSSRYDRFKAGDIAPAFDPAKSGGALMDLGIYCISYVIGLFGEPAAVRYRANVERGIDTSGIVDLDYDGFKVVCICAKDCGAPCGIQIQGTRGYIMSTSAPSICGAVTLHENDGSEQSFDRSCKTWWEAEFRTFMRQLDEGDLAGCRAQMETSLAVARTLNAARLSAGVVFPADKV